MALRDTQAVAAVAVVIACVIPCTGQTGRVDDAQKTPSDSLQAKVSQLDAQLSDAVSRARQGDRAGAAEHLKTAIQAARLIRTGTYDEYRDLADCLQKHGAAFRSMESLGEARQCYEFVVKATEAAFSGDTFPEKYTDIGVVSSELAEILVAQGNYAEARSYFERAVDVFRRHLPRDKQGRPRSRLGRELIRLGSVYRSLSQYDRSRECIEESLEIWRILAKDDTSEHNYSLAVALSDLGGVLCDQGDLQASQQALQESVHRYQELFATYAKTKAEVGLATARSSLGRTLLSAGEFARARVCFEQSLELRETLYPAEKFPAGMPSIVASLNDLGLLHREIGDADLAMNYLERALETRRRWDAEDKHPYAFPELSMLLNNLGTAAGDCQDFDRAERNLNEAIRLLQRQIPPESVQDTPPVMAMYYNNLACTLQKLERYSESRTYFEKALEIRRGAFSKEKYPRGHPLIASDLHNLGLLLRDQGEHIAAQPYLAGALAMMEQIYPVSEYPQGHPDLAVMVEGLGSYLHCSGEFDRACEVFQRAAKMKHGLAANYAFAVSETEALNFAMRHRFTLDRLVSAWRRSDRTADGLYTHLWDRRRLIGRILASRQQEIRASDEPRVRELKEQQLRTQRSLSSLVLAPADPRPAQVEARSRRVEELTRQKEAIERKLAAELPQARQRFNEKAVTHVDLVGLLPKDTAFIDLVAFTNLQQDPMTPGAAGVTHTPEYTAFILTAGKPAEAEKHVERVDLGPAAAIDEMIVTWREEIKSARVGDDTARVLRRLVWEPLEKKLPRGTKSVYICPDDLLTALPWAALPGREKNTILLEEYAFALVPHGPFLAERLAAKPAAPHGRFLAVGNLNFEKQAARVVPPPGTQPPFVTRDAVVRDEKIEWTNLPATQVEIKAVTALAAAADRKVKRLTRDGASTSIVIEEMAHARWLHFASHGFFSDPAVKSAFQPNSQAADDASNGMSTGRRALGRNPGLLCGLVCSGANVPPERDELGLPRGDGGLLTAEVIAGLPLEKLELAVLSACDTGLGQVAGNEGVFGLQRAFHMAGAQNVIASLWKVDDRATAVLMLAFYDAMWRDNEPPIEALRKAQLLIYRNPTLIDQMEKLDPAELRRLKKLLSDRAPQRMGPRADARLWAGFALSGLGRQPPIAP